jgi:hypothetical protein
MRSPANGTASSSLVTSPTFGRRATGKKQSDTLLWDVLYPHTPDEFLRDTKADPQWEWRAQPEVREAVRPLVAQEKVTSFLLEKGLA